MQVCHPVRLTLRYEPAGLQRHMRTAARARIPPITAASGSGEEILQ